MSSILLCVLGANKNFEKQNNMLNKVFKVSILV